MVLAPGSVHEDVRVDQGHGAKRSASGTDSLFIRRTVETGNLRLASRRTAATFSSAVAPPYSLLQAMRTSSPRLVPFCSARRVSRWWSSGENKIVVFLVRGSISIYSYGATLFVNPTPVPP